jgi:adenylate kinase
MLKKIVLLGAPGAGKGTHGEVLCRELNIPRISTGDLLREAVQNRTEIGLRVEALMPTGQLISDEIVMELLAERLQRPDCAEGFLLDGFPRTQAQARMLQDGSVAVEAVIELIVPDDVIIDRMAGRRIHAPSGRSYHLTLRPPAKDGVDDVTGEPLTCRPDDEASVVIKRLAIYHDQVGPILEFYRGLPEAQRPRLATVDADRNMPEVQDELFRLLDA